MKEANGYDSRWVCWQCGDLDYLNDGGLCRMCAPERADIGTSHPLLNPQTKGDFTMRRIRQVLLMLTMLLTAGMLSFPSAALCADCDQADHTCTQQEILELNDCCQMFGCNSSWSVNYCADRADTVYEGCMILKGCPPRNN